MSTLEALGPTSSVVRLGLSRQSRLLFSLATVSGLLSNSPYLPDPLFAALDEALDCPQARHLSRADRLALALWWLIESVADEFEMSTERAADEVVVLCEVAKEMFRHDWPQTLPQGHFTN